MNSSKRIGCTLIGTALALMVPTVAFGGTSLNADPSGDVWKEGGTRAAPTVFVNVDLNVVEVKHRKHAVLVNATYYDMKKGPNDFYFELVLNAQNSDESPYISQIDVGPDQRTGAHSLRGFSGAVDCPRHTHVVDYETNTISQRIPRSCLGAPEWVEFAASGVKFFPESGSAAGGRYFDDARSTDAPYTDYSERIYTPGAAPQQG